MDLVSTAKIVLNEFFNICPPAQELEEEPDTRDGSSPTMELVKPDITYDKEQLLEIAKSSMCKNTPESWDVIVKELPGVVRRPGRAGRSSSQLQSWLLFATAETPETWEGWEGPVYFLSASNRSHPQSCRL